MNLNSEDALIWYTNQKSKYITFNLNNAKIKLISFY